VTRKAFAWLGMTLLALGVAGYAITMSFAPEFRPSFVRTLFAERPVATFAHLMGGAIAAYPAISWLCWVPNLLIAEWFVRSRHALAMGPASRLGLIRA
jgi:hypothetical protein